TWVPFFHRAALLKCWRGRAGRISIRKAISSRRRVGSSDGEERTILVALATDPPPGRGHPRHPLRVVPPRRADHRQRNAMRLSALGILLGIVSHTLMGKYALMLKKHAKRVLRRWRKSRRPADRSSKPRVT